MGFKTETLAGNGPIKCNLTTITYVHTGLYSNCQVTKVHLALCFTFNMWIMIQAFRLYKQNVHIKIKNKIVKQNQS